MSDATPPLDEFLTEFDENDNAWWYLSSGDHLNLFEEAVDRMQTAEAAVRRHAHPDWADPPFPDRPPTMVARALIALLARMRKRSAP